MLRFNLDNQASAFSQADERTVKWFFAAIALACVAVYWHGFGNGLVFDDRRLVDGTVMDGYGALWPFQQRLLSYGSFVWIADLFGAENQWAQRLLNLLLHLAAATAVALLAQALLQQWLKEAAAHEPQTELDAALDKRLPLPELQSRSTAAWAVGVGWFALSPVAVYAVGYLIQRSIVMASLFTALACWAWVKALQLPRLRSKAGLAWSVLALLSAWCAFLSKEHALLVPALAVPLFVYVRRPSLQSLLLAALVAALAVAALAALLWSRFGSLLGAASFDETSAAYVRELAGLQGGALVSPFLLSVANQAKLFFFYLGYWLVPNVTAMSIDMRPAFPLSLVTFSVLSWVLGFVTVLLASIWALLARRDGWSLWGLCTLCAMALFGTELATTWIQDPFVLYRSYLWAIFIPPAMVVALTALPRKLIVGLGGALLLVLAVLSYERLSVFKTEFSVWDDAAHKVDMQAAPQAFGRWRPFLNRGTNYLEQDNGSAQMALGDFDQAVRLGEPLGSAQFNRGMALQLLGQYNESVLAFSEAEKQGFDAPALYYQTAVSLRSMGSLDNALMSIAKALSLNPDPLTKEHLKLMGAEIYTQGGAHAQAAEQYAELLDLAPGNGKYLVGLGMAAMALGDAPKALTQFNEALRLREDPAAYFARGLLQVRMGGNPSAALADLEKALELDPDNALYQQMLGNVRAQIQGAAAPQPGPLRPATP